MFIPGGCRVIVHRPIDVPDSFEMFGVSMNRDCSGNFLFRNQQGHGPYEHPIAAWKQSGIWLDKLIEYCNTIPIEEFGCSIQTATAHPYRWYPGTRNVVKNGEVDMFMKILKQIVVHREELNVNEASGTPLTNAQKRLLRFYESILDNAMKEASCCWMNLIRSFQRNKAGVYDQPYTRKGKDYYTVEQQQTLMAPRFLALSTRVISYYILCLLVSHDIFLAVGLFACTWRVKWPRNVSEENQQDLLRC